MRGQREAQQPGPACFNAWRSEHEPGLLEESSQSSKQKVPALTRRATLQGKHSANAFKSISGLLRHKELMGMEDRKGVCNYHHCAGEPVFQQHLESALQMSFFFFSLLLALMQVVVVLCEWFYTVLAFSVLLCCQRVTQLPSIALSLSLALCV